MSHNPFWLRSVDRPPVRGLREVYEVEYLPTDRSTGAVTVSGLLAQSAMSPGFSYNTTQQFIHSSVTVDLVGIACSGPPNGINVKDIAFFLDFWKSFCGMLIDDRYWLERGGTEWRKAAAIGQRDKLHSRHSCSS